MRCKILNVLACLVAATAIFQLSSCSLIGLGIGAISDASKPDQATIQNHQLVAIKPGTICYITLRNEELLIGKFIGIDRVPEDEYAENYAKSRKQNRDVVFLPALGDSIILKLTTEKNLKCNLLGFDFNYVAVQLNARTEPIRVNLGIITTIMDSDGNLIEGETVRNLISEGRIPLMSAIVIQNLFQNENDSTRVTMDEVSQIELQVKKSGKLTGFLVGAVVDVAFFVYLNFIWDDYWVIDRSFK